MSSSIIGTAEQIGLFNVSLKVGSDGADRTTTGRLFQVLGPATANARPPRTVRVLGTYSWPVSADRRQSDDLDEAGEITYSRSAMPFTVLYIMTPNLNTIRCSMGSQCRACRSGVT